MTVTLTLPRRPRPDDTGYGPTRAGVPRGLTKAAPLILSAALRRAALLGQSPDLAAIEMTGTAGTFTAGPPTSASR